MEKLFIALTVDADPDNFDASVFGRKAKLSWRGIEQGIADFLKRFKVAPRITWFVRCDTELFDNYGTYGYLFERFADFWRERDAVGDEIAWHPHEADIRGLKASYAHFRKIYPAASSVRIGNAFHSDAFMEQLNSWGFRVDSTAMPGRKRNDTERILDWSISPHRPYYPSVNDYRTPGGRNLRILEVPMSMIPIKVAYDAVPVLRYINLGFHSEALKPWLPDYIRANSLLVLNLHPSELLPAGKKHALLSFDPAVAVRNLKFIVSEAEKAGKKAQFICLKDVPKLVKKGKIRHE